MGGPPCALMTLVDPAQSAHSMTAKASHRVESKVKYDMSHMTKFALLQYSFVGRISIIITAKVYRETYEAAHALPLEPCGCKGDRDHRHNDDDRCRNGHGRRYDKGVVAARIGIPSEHHTKV